MFTRNPSAEPLPLRPANADSNGTRIAPPRPRPGEALPKSVIGNDLKIIGQGLKIVSQGTLQVDGEIEGDVGGAEVIIGEQGKVTGTVAAAQVIVRGTVLGVIRGGTVSLQSSCHVEADVHHMSLAIEQGAHFHGHSRRAANAAELTADLVSTG
jgi:cytoskeletal protein CcmA (bactofilin family)